MADLSDITAYLAGVATTAVYPNGTSQPSVANMDIRVYEGWPIPGQLDLDVQGMTLVGVPTGNPPVARAGGPLINVSVYPMQGNTSIPYQIQQDTFTIVPPNIGLSLSIVGSLITFSGTLQPGEFVSLVVDGAFVFSQTGTSTANLINNLATAIAVDYPGVTFTTTTLTVPFGRSMTVRQGGVGTIGYATHRQRQNIMITIWAPTHATRSIVAAAIDVYLKNNIRATMTDTSQALFTYDRTNVTDEQQVATIYRRDLIYCAEYATVFQTPGVPITSVTTTIQASSTNPALAQVTTLT